MFDYVALKNYIDENGIKQCFVAQQAKLSDTLLSAIVNGRTKCTLDNYINICVALSVPFGTFINKENAAQPA